MVGIDAKVQVAVVVIGAAAAAYLAGYDPLAIALGWVAQAVAWLYEATVGSALDAGGALWTEFMGALGVALL